MKFIKNIRLRPCGSLKEALTVSLTLVLVSLVVYEYFVFGARLMPGLPTSKHVTREEQKGTRAEEGKPATIGAVRVGEASTNKATTLMTSHLPVVSSRQKLSSSSLSLSSLSSSSFTSNSSSSSPSSSPSSSNATASLSLCPERSPHLVGGLRVMKERISLEEVERKHGDGMATGGVFRPPNCLARHRVAIVIPFRDREEHLHIFLNNLVPMLKRQQLEFAVYVVDQAVGSKFNRAMLMNIGFVEAMKDRAWACFVFHDVDLIPENDHNVYSCPSQPRHMSVAVDTMNYKLPYTTIFGGVSALTTQQFQNINGFSNKFFGWGGEDDDLYNRITSKGYKLIRYPISVARYSMLTHKKEQGNPERFHYLRTGKRRMENDGLNSLQYKVSKLDRSKLFTKVTVEIDEKLILRSR